MVVIWYKKNIITWLNHNFLDQTFYVVYDYDASQQTKFLFL